ncbi:hydrogenase/urease maturation nickel metallochaperone HypA [Stygiolobus caldivivus]|uniref:Hydrogenase maturation factor HypA n=1 Tax=Stygiolobus caldivivus TaxID=2824673 RepID=A0A8D5U587_9CREN|nr:hydrogenase/urease maturation nickel metallochaperone HypA [Stygiolobus caldivivus]BCU69701.1 hydrogenase expression/synthesis, HypA [Stygiolobus caldivivus]
MHEWSVAEGILRSVIEWAKENNLDSVRKVKVAIPSFTFLELDILKEAYDTLKRGTVLEKSSLEVVYKDPLFKCRNCGNTFNLNQVLGELNEVREEFGEEYPLHLVPGLAPAFIKCPKCGSNDVEVSPQDITIEEVEVNGTAGSSG